MGVEAYFATPDDGPRWTVAEFVRQLTVMGYPCREVPDVWGHWVMFDGGDSTLNFSVEDGAAVFVTFDMVTDPPEFLAAVEHVFTQAGWIASPEE